MEDQIKSKSSNPRIFSLRRRVRRPSLRLTNSSWHLVLEKNSSNTYCSYISLRINTLRACLASLSTAVFLGQTSFIILSMVPAPLIRLAIKFCFIKHTAIPVLMSVVFSCRSTSFQIRFIMVFHKHFSIESMAGLSRVRKITSEEERIFFSTALLRRTKYESMKDL